jgi:hypothetical protein
MLERDADSGLSAVRRRSPAPTCELNSNDVDMCVVSLLMVRKQVGRPCPRVGTRKTRQTGVACIKALRRAAEVVPGFPADFDQWNPPARIIWQRAPIGEPKDVDVRVVSASGD